MCILGLNENKGARILLRIRTDDLTGFRNLSTITKTLCHELAHNVHGDHDASFYTLMRQVEAEVVALNWRQSKGQTVSGARIAAGGGSGVGGGGGFSGRGSVADRQTTVIWIAGQINISRNPEVEIVKRSPERAEPPI